MAIDPRLLNDLIEQQKVIVRELNRLLDPYTESMNKLLQQLPDLNKEAAEELRRQLKQMETTLGSYRAMSRRFQEMVGPQMKTLQDAVAAMKPQFDAMAKRTSSATEAMEKIVRSWALKLNPKPHADEKKPGPDEKA
jgi:methyl-accepting chemotaxis protein